MSPPIRYPHVLLASSKPHYTDLVLNEAGKNKVEVTVKRTAAETADFLLEKEQDISAILIHGYLWICPNRRPGTYSTTELELQNLFLTKNPKETVFLPFCRFLKAKGWGNPSGALWVPLYFGEREKKYAKSVLKAELGTEDKSIKPVNSILGERELEQFFQEIRVL